MSWIPALIASFFGVFSPESASDIRHELERLQTTGRVLYIAAHPDDENTQLLAWLASHRGYRAAYLSLTRGDGGQNLIGNEQRDGLGVIRTWELLAARNQDRAEQFIATLRDFGYSKSADETLEFWGRERALRDMVQVIRTFRPHVMITRFPEQGETHGHHLASAQLARLAFSAAADPEVFPEQLVDVEPWQAARLMQNVPTWNLLPENIDPTWITVNVGEYNGVLGASYGEIASRSRSLHRSQGFGWASRRGNYQEYLLPLEGEYPDDLTTLVDDPLAELGVSWQAQPMGEPVGQALADALNRWRVDEPLAVVEPLLDAWRATEALPDTALAAQTRSRIAELIVAADGLFVDVRTATAAVPAEQTVTLTWEAISRMGATDAVTAVRVLDAVTAGEPVVLERNVLATGSLDVVPGAETLGSHYWLHEGAQDAHDGIDDLALVGDPLPSRAWFAELDVEVAGETLTLVRPVRHVRVDPVLGERVRPAQTMPPVAVTPLAGSVMSVSGQPATVRLELAAFVDADDVRVRLELPEGWSSVPAESALSMANGGRSRVDFRVTPAPGAAATELTPVVDVAGASWSWQAPEITYEHIPEQWMVTRSRVRVVPLDVEPPTARVAHVAGPGDLVAESLRQVGVAVEDVSAQDLDAATLAGFDTVLVGIRAFNVEPALHDRMPALLEWVEQGGVLVIQYQTNSRIGPLAGELGPSPMVLGRGRVTDETAAVELLGDHAILRTPHALTAADFDGWIQERGLYFVESWSEGWTPLMRMADPGEAAQDGALMVHEFGAGRVVYCGLSLFRQLPAGVAGAYRLALNLVAPAESEVAP